MNAPCFLRVDCPTSADLIAAFVRSVVEWCVLCSTIVSGDDSYSIKSPSGLSRQNDRSFLQLEFEIRPVLLVEVLVDFFRDVIEFLRPTFEDRVGVSGNARHRLRSPFRGAAVSGRTLD